MKQKKIKLQCMKCMPPTDLLNHNYFNGVIVHTRTDCPPDMFYMINKNLFENPVEGDMKLIDPEITQ